MNISDLFDDKKIVVSDKQVINRLNSITDKQTKTILELENKIISLEGERTELREQIITLKKKIFDIEIENKILCERITELDSIRTTPVESKVSLEDDLEKKKLKIIQERLQKKAVLYASLKSARRGIIERKENEVIQT